MVVRGCTSRGDIASERDSGIIGMKYVECISRMPTINIFSNSSLC